MNDRYTLAREGRGGPCCRCWRRLVASLLTVLCLVSWPGIGVAHGTHDAAHIASSQLPMSDSMNWFEVATRPADRDLAEEVGFLADADVFRPASRASVNRGFTDQAIWARFSLLFDRSDEAHLVLVLSRPMLDHVTLFEISGAGQVRSVQTGDYQPFHTRELDYRGFAFHLTAAPGTQKTYLVRVASETNSSAIPLAIMSEPEFRSLQANENLIFGAYFGVMLALAFAALVLSTYFRQALFGFYATYIASFLLAAAAFTGYGMQYLWPDMPLVQRHMPAVMAALAMISGILFVQRFLVIDTLSPLLGRVLKAVMLVAVTGAVVHLLSPTRIGSLLVLAAGMTMCPVMFHAGMLAIRSGDRVGRYVVVGWMALLLGVLCKAFDSLGVAPSGAVASYGLYAGSVVEFMALSMALGIRLNTSQAARAEELASKSAQLAALNHNLEDMVTDRTQELEQRNRELSELAIHDSLTGLYNHSASIELLEQIINQGQRYNFPVAVVMVDIDHFKDVNDRHGHQSGDALLEALSQAMLDTARDSDMVGRYGGDEFIIAMPHADAHAAREFGERLMKRARETSIPRSDGLGLTISIGIAICTPESERTNAMAMIERADEALYKSKRAGRDRLNLDALNIAADNSSRAEQGKSGG